MNSFKLVMYTLLCGLTVGLIGAVVDLVFHDVYSAMGLMLLSSIVTINKMIHIIDCEIGLGVHLATATSEVRKCY